MFDTFEQLAKKMPSMIIFAVVVSTLYNVGFLSATGNAELITNLSYQDIITSSVFAIAIIIPAFFVINALQRSIVGNVYLDTIFKKILYALILCGGILCVLYFPHSYVGWFALSVTLIPISVKFIEKLELGIDRDAVASASIVVIISLAAFGYGQSLHANKLCFGNQYYLVAEERKLILQIYSDFLILHNSENHIEIRPNNHNFAIITDSSKIAESLESSKCNPIGVWVKEKFAQFKGQVS